jgi:hypothetical protein
MPLVSLSNGIESRNPWITGYPDIILCKVRFADNTGIGGLTGGGTESHVVFQVSRLKTPNI